MDIPGIAESQGKTKTAYKLFVGYDFTKNWAVEGGYADFGKPQYNYSGLGLTGDATVKNTSWFVDAKGTLPLNDQFNLFAKLGLTVNKTEIHVLTNNAAFNAFAGLPANFSKTSNDLHLGVGGEYSFTKNIAARFEYEGFGTFGDSGDNGETKTSMWSVGLGYKF